MRNLKRITRSKIFVGISGVVALVMMLPTGSLADEITWSTRDWFNHQYLENGELKGWGMDIQRMIQRELPQYQHRNQIMNPARRSAEFRAMKNICSIGLFKNTEREEYMHFGMRNMMTFPLRLYMRREIFEKLGRPDLLSLQALLENNQGVLGITKGRSYGVVLDAILTRFEESVSILTSSQLEQKFSGFLMLEAARLDFVIEYPDDMNTTKFRKNIVAVPIEELPDMLFGNVACAKTEWGAKAIKAINEAVFKLRPTEAYRGAYESTLRADEIRIYRKQYDGQFLNASE